MPKVELGISNPPSDMADAKEFSPDSSTSAIGQGCRPPTCSCRCVPPPTCKCKCVAPEPRDPII